MPKQNTRYQPMTLREIVGLFALPIKKPPDSRPNTNQADSAGLVGGPDISLAGVKANFERR
ncbi:hypothetical protein JZO76_07320 [Enterococcus sp. MJM12]|uniref:Uncharacterized protein n=1 Tax=Candidatus Enterococcus myersii TaxID=2815322 RepID=A0ABS3H847_9ENTE|nr:hypothetical protein [Enterococcus sp. MJM12]MBO0449348.1 hypothetical protein [Enterococcus sp. MJM12]